MRGVKDRALHVAHEVRPSIGAFRAVAAAAGVTYGTAMVEETRPESLVDQAVPDLALPSSAGGEFRLRGRVGQGPLVLFFYIRGGTPG